MEEAATAVEAAVAKTLEDGIMTADIAPAGSQGVSTAAMGDAIVERLAQ